jgi:hypothetical protein
MAKLGKKNKGINSESEISDSGVLSMDMDEFNTAVERRTWGGGGGSRMPAVGDYDARITEIIRGESKGAATGGSPAYQTKVEIVGGEFAGSGLNIFTIAHGTTMQRYLKFLEAVMGIAPDAIESVNGRPQIPIISQSAAEKQVGKIVRVHVNHRARNDGSKNADGTPRMGTDNDFVITEADAKAEKKKAKKSKIAE